MPVPSRPSRREVALTAVCYLAIAIVVTIRLWLHPTTATVAGNPADADQAAWFLRYGASAIAHLHLPALITDAMNAPHGISLMWNPSIALPGVVLAPITLLAGPQVSLTVLMTCGFAGSALAMYCVLRSWGATPAAAAIAGFGYGFSPAVVHSAIGHYDLQFAVLPPLMVSAALRLVTVTSRSGPLRTGILLGALASAQLFIDEEILLETAITVAIAVIVLAASRPSLVRSRIEAAVPGVLAAAGTGAILAGYALWTQFLGPLRGSGNLYTPDFYKNDLAGFVEPSGMELFHTSGSAAFAARFQGGPPEYLGYIGIPMLILLVWIAVRYWRTLPVRVMVVLFGVLSVLSLGGTLLLFGHDHLHAKLPWYLVQTAPVFGPAVVDRFSIVADGAAMAALALCPMWQEFSRYRLWRITVPLAVAVVAVAPLVPRPLEAGSTQQLPAGWLAAFRELRLPTNARVLVLPVPSGANTLTMRWQADTGQPRSIYGGYFIGAAWDGKLYIGGDGLPSPIYDLNQLWYTSPSQSAPTRSVLLSQLASWHPAAILAVTGPTSPLATYLDRLLGNPTFTTPTVQAWRD